MKVDIYNKGFDELEKKFDKFLNSNYKDEIANKFAEVGVKIAQQYYGGSHIQVYAEPAVDGKSAIVAEGKGVGYMEFGTGVVGEQAGYQGNLPTRPLTFYSRGASRITEGWQYNYAKKQGITGFDWKGTAPQAQMFKTAQDLEADKGNIVARILNGGILGE